MSLTVSSVLLTFVTASSISVCVFTSDNFVPSVNSAFSTSSKPKSPSNSSNDFEVCVVTSSKDLFISFVSISSIILFSFINLSIKAASSAIVPNFLLFASCHSLATFNKSSRFFTPLLRNLELYSPKLLTKSSTFLVPPSPSEERLISFPNRFNPGTS